MLRGVAEKLKATETVSLYIRTYYVFINMQIPITCSLRDIPLDRNQRLVCLWRCATSQVYLAKY